MHTLLIDNHDSFTYNLYQYLAAANDNEPTVVRNDELPWAKVEAMAFDNIVISPGPGRPQRASDLGISADALRFSDVPILGVCLGHQAMAHFSGATVDLAKRPMHGRLDKVSHVDCGLFRGIPSPFEAVRYHSLAATLLPSNLEELAWTPDGTLMALRHLHRPWWGVQFHPESICTEFGARLLANFRDLTQEWLMRHDRLQGVQGDGSSQSGTRIRPKGSRFSVHIHRLEHFPEPEAVFSACFADAEAAFWLDSSAPDGQRGRFSYMGDARGPAAQVVTYRSAEREVHIHGPESHMPRTVEPNSPQGSVFDFLQERLADCAVPAGDWPFEFLGGYVGYLGYELRGELQGQPTPQASTPDALWIFADRFVAFDHFNQEAWILCLDEGPLSKPNQEWMRALEQRLDTPDLAAPILHETGAEALQPLAWRIPLPEYRALIERCQEEILQGETYEACLTNQLVCAGAIDDWNVYRVLRRNNPAPYAAFLKSGSLAVLCASPELFLELAADGTLESKPIKGTVGRGLTPEQDALNTRFLREDEKTRAENLMIVDLLRNDLARVCEVGSVHVPVLFHVESFKTVHQLVSTIRGQLHRDKSVVDALLATFPGGSMTGAPKIRTMRILDALEGTARGIYAGSLGFLSLDGQAKLNIVIRTIVCDGASVSIGSGGAIVAMSDPDAEVDEIVLKARAQYETLRACGAPAMDAPSTASHDAPDTTS